MILFFCIHMYLAFGCAIRHIVGYRIPPSADRLRRCDRSGYREWYNIGVRCHHHGFFLCFLTELASNRIEFLVFIVLRCVHKGKIAPILKLLYWPIKTLKSSG